MARLRALGYGVRAAPTVATAPLAFDPPDLGAFDWVVVPNPCGPGGCSSMPGGAGLVVRYLA